MLIGNRNKSYYHYYLYNLDKSHPLMFCFGSGTPTSVTKIMKKDQSIYIYLKNKTFLHFVAL